MWFPVILEKSASGDMLMIGTCVIILDMSIQTQKKPLLLLTHPHVYLCMYMYMCVSSMYVTAAAGPDHERRSPELDFEYPRHNNVYWNHK